MSGTGKKQHGHLNTFAFSLPHDPGSQDPQDPENTSLFGPVPISVFLSPSITQWSPSDRLYPSLCPECGDGAHTAHNSSSQGGRCRLGQFDLSKIFSYEFDCHSQHNTLLLASKFSILPNFPFLRVLLHLYPTIFSFNYEHEHNSK